MQIVIDALPASDVNWYHLQSIWAQIRSDKKSGLIWILTAWHSDGIPKKNRKKFILKKIADDKNMKNYQEGKYLRQCSITGTGNLKITLFAYGLSHASTLYHATYGLFFLVDTYTIAFDGRLNIQWLSPLICRLQILFDFNWTS